MTGPSEDAVDLHPHRCGACGAPWGSTDPDPEPCPFCGAEPGAGPDGEPEAERAA